MIAIVFAAVALPVVITSLFWPKSYRAQSSVVFESIGTDPVSGVEQPSDLLPSALATQLDVIASRNVALKVVDKLDLTKNAELRDKFFDGGGNADNFRDWIADRLLVKNLDVEPSKEGKVINIVVTTHDPKLSSDMANAFASSYILTHLELKMEPARRQAAWFDTQLEALRRNVESAQARLSDYQRQKAVVGTDARIDVENARLDEISNQLIAAQTTMFQGQARLKQMNEAVQQDTLQELPDLQGNALLQNLKANLAMAEGKLAQISSNFGHNHPDYISAEAQVKELRRRILAEVDVAKGSISRSAEISSRQEQQLRHALEQQRDRVLALKRDQDSLDVLRREVDNAQRAYDVGVQRATQVRLEGQLDQSNIAVLNQAIAPTGSSSPRVLLNFILSVVLGSMLGVAVALALEMSEPKLRVGYDLETLLGLPLLAQIPQPSGSRATRLSNRLLPGRSRAMIAPPVQEAEI
ncbi:MAG: chain length determinant protein EpsF [Acidobacteriota bacterium]|nr:chain length determinant protein EpsF [Acidobacteriota bacterium]